MTRSSELGELAERLAESVRAEWEWDTPFGGWLADEGERVLSNAIALVEAVRTDTVRTLLGQDSLNDFLGDSWLQVHSKTRELVESVERLLRGR